MGEENTRQHQVLNLNSTKITKQVLFESLKTEKSAQENTKDFGCLSLNII